MLSMMRAEAREDVEHEDDNTDADDVWLAQRISLYAIAPKHIISDVSIHAWGFRLLDSNCS